jgi:hypothetical protein
VQVLHGVVPGLHKVGIGGCGERRFGALCGGFVADDSRECAGGVPFAGKRTGMWDEVREVSLICRFLARFQADDSAERSREMSM